MKKLVKIFVVVLLSVSFFVRCDAYKNANNAQKGAVIGAASGAILGAILGGKNAELGAVLGTAIGGAAGAVIGNQMDNQARKIEEEIPGAEVKRVDDGIVVTFDENSGVYFATNSSSLNDKSKETLDKLIAVLKEYDKTNVLIAGHTDSTGKASYNMKLSERRAKSVTKYFEQKGLSPDRLTTKWFGQTQPEYSNDTAEGRAKNRRVNIVIVPNEQMKKEAEQQAY